MRKQSCRCHTGRLSWNGPRAELKLSVDRSDRAKKGPIRFPRAQPAETAIVTRAVTSFMLPLDSSLTKSSKISRLRQVSGRMDPVPCSWARLLLCFGPCGGEPTGPRAVGSLTKAHESLGHGGGGGGTPRQVPPLSIPSQTTRPEIGSIGRSTVMTHTKSLGILPLLRGFSSAIWKRAPWACRRRCRQKVVCASRPRFRRLSLGEHLQGAPCKLHRITSTLFGTSQSWRPGDVDWGPSTFRFCHAWNQQHEGNFSLMPSCPLGPEGMSLLFLAEIDHRTDFHGVISRVFELCAVRE
jgi:hypothetical protein